MSRLFIFLLAMFCCLLPAGAFAKISINLPPEIGTTVAGKDLEELMVERGSLLARYDRTREMIDRQEANCRSVEDGSPKVNECLAEAATVKAAVREYRAALNAFKANLARAQQLQQSTIAEKQVQALTCAIRGLQAEGEEGSQLRTELNNFLEHIRGELSAPCSGQPETRKIQTLFLSGLSKGKDNGEDQAVGNLLVSRDEKTCEVFLDVQHAPSAKARGLFSADGEALIHMDKAGNILAAETRSDVEKCLAGLSTKANRP